MSVTGRMWRHNWRLDFSVVRFATQAASSRCPMLNSRSSSPASCLGYGWSFMRMAITWRNPHPVQTSHRYAKVTDIASCSVYVIQEVISGAQENKWADLCTLEVQDGGRVSGTRSQTSANCASPATAAKGERELTQALVVSRICPLVGLRRGVSSVAKSVQL